MVVHDADALAARGVRFILNSAATPVSGSVTERYKMIDQVVAFLLLLALMASFAAFVSGATKKGAVVMYTIGFSLIMIGLSFPNLVELAPTLRTVVVEATVSSVEALKSVL